MSENNKNTVNHLLYNELTSIRAEFDAICARHNLSPKPGKDTLCRIPETFPHDIVASTYNLLHVSQVLLERLGDKPGYLTFAKQLKFLYSNMTLLDKSYDEILKYAGSKDTQHYSAFTHELAGYMQSVGSRLIKIQDELIVFLPDAGKAIYNKKAAPELPILLQHLTNYMWQYEEFNGKTHRDQYTDLQSANDQLEAWNEFLGQQPHSTEEEIGVLLQDSVSLKGSIDMMLQADADTPELPDNFYSLDKQASTIGLVKTKQLKEQVQGYRNALQADIQRLTKTLAEMTAVREAQERAAKVAAQKKQQEEAQRLALGEKAFLQTEIQAQKQALTQLQRKLKLQQHFTPSDLVASDDIENKVSWLKREIPELKAAITQISAKLERYKKEDPSTYQMIAKLTMEGIDETKEKLAEEQKELNDLKPQHLVQTGLKTIAELKGKIQSLETSLFDHQAKLGTIQATEAKRNAAKQLLDSIELGHESIGQLQNLIVDNYSGPELNPEQLKGYDLAIDELASKQAKLLADADEYQSTYAEEFPADNVGNLKEEYLQQATLVTHAEKIAYFKNIQAQDKTLDQILTNLNAYLEIRYEHYNLTDHVENAVSYATLGYFETTETSRKNFSGQLAASVGLFKQTRSAQDLSGIKSMLKRSPQHCFFSEKNDKELHGIMKQAYENSVALTA